MTYSEEAIDAAAEAIRANLKTKSIWDVAKSALEAAGPILMAEGWDRAVGSLVYNDGSKVEVAANLNPFRSAA